MSKIKNYKRFIELIRDRKYALAYAISNRYPNLKKTQQYLTMERNFQTAYTNAQEFIILNLQSKAKKQIDIYITVLSKRELLQLIINNPPYLKEFLISYKNNDFRNCYELIDKHNRLNLLEIAILLNKHWSKLIKTCNVHAQNGSTKYIKETLTDLVFIKSRRNEIDNLFKLSLCNKIKNNLQDKKNNFAESNIYLYIDNFGEDKDIKKLMQNFEKTTLVKLAITQ